MGKNKKLKLPHFHVSDTHRVAASSQRNIYLMPSAAVTLTLVTLGTVMLPFYERVRLNLKKAVDETELEV